MWPQTSAFWCCWRSGVVLTRKSSGSVIRREGPSRSWRANGHITTCQTAPEATHHIPGHHTPTRSRSSARISAPPATPECTSVGARRENMLLPRAQRGIRGSFHVAAHTVGQPSKSWRSKLYPFEHGRGEGDASASGNGRPPCCRPPVGRRPTGKCMLS